MIGLAGIINATVYMSKLIFSGMVNYHNDTTNGKGAFTHARSRSRWRQAENWLQHKPLHSFTHMWSWSRGGAGAKSTPQQVGPTPNFLCPLRNHVLQTIAEMSKSAHLHSATVPRIYEHSLRCSPTSCQWHVKWLFFRKYWLTSWDALMSFAADDRHL